jgi:hypothetical protein
VREVYSNAGIVNNAPLSPGLNPITPRTAHIGVVEGESISNIRHHQFSTSDRQYTSPVNQYVPSTSRIHHSPPRVFEHERVHTQSNIPREHVSYTHNAHAPLSPGNVVHNYHDSYVPRTAYEKTLDSQRVMSPSRPGTHSSILERYSPRQTELHFGYNPVTEVPVVYNHRVEPYSYLPDSQKFTHTAPGLNIDSKFNTSRGKVADTSAHKEVTKVTQPRID